MEESSRANAEVRGTLIGYVIRQGLKLDKDLEEKLLIDSRPYVASIVFAAIGLGITFYLTFY